MKSCQYPINNKKKLYNLFSWYGTDANFFLRYCIVPMCSLNSGSDFRSLNVWHKRIAWDVFGDNFPYFDFWHGTMQIGCRALVFGGTNDSDWGDNGSSSWGFWVELRRAEALAQWCLGNLWAAHILMPRQAVSSGIGKVADLSAAWIHPFWDRHWMLSSPLWPFRQLLHNVWTSRNHFAAWRIRNC